MSIVLKEGDSLGIWYLSLPKDFVYDDNHVGGDWVCHLGYEELNGKRTMVIRYRFRYYTKNDTRDPFEDDDIKSWYSAQQKKDSNGEPYSEAYMIASTREMAKKMAEVAGSGLYENLVGNDFDAFFKRFQDAPFAWVKQATKEQLEEFEKEHEKKVS